MSRILGIFFLAFGILMSLLGTVGLVISLVNMKLNAPVVVPIIFGFVGLIGFVFLLFGITMMRKGTPIGAIQSIPKTEDGRVGGYLANQPEQREHNGQPYEVQYLLPVSGKNGRPSALHVRRTLVTPASLKFQQEGSFDRFCKKIGISKECETGDADFDQAIYVRCNSSEYAEQYLSDPNKREAILALRKLGYRDIQLTGQQAVVNWPGFDPHKHDHPELATATADLLTVLSTDLPADNPDFAPGQDFRTFWLVMLWLFLFCYCLTIITTFIYPPLHFVGLLSVAAPVFIGGYVLFGWISAFLLSGTSNSHDRWLPLILVGFFLHMLGSVGTVSAINSLGDTGPLTEHSQTILSKRTHTSSGKNRKTTYHATINSWEPGGGTMEFSVSSGDYARIKEGRSKLQIVTGSGRLGFEWIQAKNVVP